MTGDEALRRETWSLMAAVVLRFNSNRKQVADELGMSFGRVRMLRRIAAHGPMPMRELVTMMASDAANVTVTVDALEQRGLVIREPHPSDRRAKIVSATAAGKKAARHANAILAQPPAGFDHLDDAQVATLHDLLETVLGDDATVSRVAGDATAVPSGD